MRKALSSFRSGDVIGTCPKGGTAPDGGGFRGAGGPVAPFSGVLKDRSMVWALWGERATPPQKSEQQRGAKCPILFDPCQVLGPGKVREIPQAATQWACVAA